MKTSHEPKKKDPSMKWFRFYVYRTGIGAALTLLPIIAEGGGALFFMIQNPIYGLIAVVSIFALFLAIGLEAKSLLAYRLNFFYIVLEAFIISFFSIANSGTVRKFEELLVFSLIIAFPFFLISWVLPNFIYFKKRKGCFQKES